MLEEDGPPPVPELVGVVAVATVAEGLVDIYPRFGPTMLWDVAAGQSIIEEAGGQVLWADNYHLMTYNINHMKNKSFIAMNKPLKKRVVA